MSRFIDATGERFWVVERERAAVTVTFGAVGENGRARTLAFDDPETAEMVVDRLTRDRLNRGYREWVGGTTAEALERGLWDHRDETPRWSAYADHLIESGDPRGELTRLQFELEGGGLTRVERRRWRKRVAELTAAHWAAWLGPLATHATPDGDAGAVPCRFRRGRLADVTFRHLTVVEARALAACPDGRLLDTLAVDDVAEEDEDGAAFDPDYESYYPPGPDVPRSLGPESAPALHALLRCPQLTAVREFRLGRPLAWYPGGCDPVVALVGRMPRLERLEVYADRADAGRLCALPLPALRALALYVDARDPLDRLAANPSLVALRELYCDAAYWNRPDPLFPADDVMAVGRSPHLTGLTHLTLRGGYGDAGVRALIASGLAGRLRVLDLACGGVTDAGVAALAACPAARGLKRLDLRANPLTAYGVRCLRTLRAEGVTVLVGRRRPAALNPAPPPPGAPAGPGHRPTPAGRNAMTATGDAAEWDDRTALAACDAHEGHFECHWGVWVFPEDGAVCIFENRGGGTPPYDAVRKREMAAFRLWLAENGIRELGYAEYPPAAGEDAGYTFAMMLAAGSDRASEIFAARRQIFLRGFADGTESPAGAGS